MQGFIVRENSNSEGFVQKKERKKETTRPDRVRDEETGSDKGDRVMGKQGR